VLLALGLGLAMGAGIERWVWPNVVSSGSGFDFSLVAQAWTTIQRHYVDRSAIQRNTLTYGAISGMVDALGDTGHSDFLTPGMAKQLGVIGAVGGWLSLVMRVFDIHHWRSACSWSPVRNPSS
jgi:hypothetical protein